MKFKILDCSLASAESQDILIDLFERNGIEVLLSDYHDLPKGFNIKLIDKKAILDNRELHSFIRTVCWVLIDDGSKSVFPDIYKTAIHKVSWDQMINHSEREILLVLEKCFTINKLFHNDSGQEIIQIQKLDNSLVDFRIEKIYLFTTINKNTCIYYQSEEGDLERMYVKNSLSFLEDKLQVYKFYRTHKNYLVNVNQLNDKLDLNSDHIKIGDQLVAKLSKQKQDDFITFLENL